MPRLVASCATRVRMASLVIRSLITIILSSLGAYMSRIGVGPVHRNVDQQQVWVRWIRLIDDLQSAAVPPDLVGRNVLEHRRGSSVGCTLPPPCRGLATRAEPSWAQP